MWAFLLGCTTAPSSDTAGSTDSVDTAETGDTAAPTAYCDDGTVARPFDFTAAGADYGGLAGDVTVPTDAGDWSLGSTWTGCDSYVFIGVSATDGYTSLLLDDDLAQLLKKGPEHAHYVLFADASAADAPALQAQLRTLVDASLDAIPANRRDEWATRVHVATVRAADAPGWIGALFGTYQFPVVGVDHAQTLREVGYLADPLTSWTTATWDTLGYEVQLYTFESQRQARLDAEGATVVRVFDAADTRTADWTGVSTVELPDAATMAGFNRVEVDVTLACGGPWYDACPAWDTSDYFWRCDNDDPATEADESQTCEEMSRIITGYWRGGRWVTDGRHQLPALLDGGPHTFRYTGSMANIVTVDLRFYHDDTAFSPTGAQQLWWETGDFWDATYDERHATHPVDIPTDATHVELVAILTGHGSDGHGCGEFCPSEQTFTLNGGAAWSVDFPTAGSRDGCAERVATDGSLPNQAGTWTYGRNGWCPGLAVAPVAWDVSADALAGTENTVGYQALLRGEPYVTDGDGNLDVGVWVVWGN